MIKNETRVASLEQQLRSSRRQVVTLAVVTAVVVCAGAAQGPLVDLVCNSVRSKSMTVQSDDGKASTRLTPGVIEADIDIRLGGKSMKNFLSTPPAIKFAVETVFVRGANEATAPGRPHAQFVNKDCVQTLDFPVPDHRTVIGAWPVIVDHHADYGPKYRRFWRDWIGYFAANSSGKKFHVGGTPQSEGFFVIDIGYLYTEDLTDRPAGP